MNLLATAVEWLAGAQEAAAGVAVTYARGTAPAVPLTAVVGASSVLVTQIGQTAVRAATTDREYLFRTAALTTAGLFPPATGDRVTETLNGVPVTFVVTAGTETAPAWEWGEPERQTVRVRCTPAKES